MRCCGTPAGSPDQPSWQDRAVADAPPTSEPIRMSAVAPATGESLGAVPVASGRAVEAAVAEARAVQRLWAQLRLSDRARYMARAAQAVIDESDDLAALLCREQGRARAEIETQVLLPAIETLQWLAENGPGVLGGERVRLSRLLPPLTRARWRYEPLGVVALLAPGPDTFRAPLGAAAAGLVA